MADDIRPRASWDEYFMSIAQVVATRSTCPRKYVGAVLVRNRTILSTGYIYIWRKGVLDWGPDEVRARMAARARKVSDGTRTAA